MISAVVPWRAGCGWRERALEFVVARLERVADQVVVGETSGTWCKATAVENGMRLVDGEFVAVVDADVFLRDETWLARCVDRLEAGAGWASPHGTVWRLDRAATDAVLNGGNSRETEAKHTATAGGGVVVLRREDYEVAPLDRRFVGWGQEDEAWAVAMTTMLGPAWIGGRVLWHLWHPKQERVNRAIGSYEGLALRMRYEAAAGDRESVRALIEEVACASR